jgi:hypothetical protein
MECRSIWWWTPLEKSQEVTLTRKTGKAESEGTMDQHRWRESLVAVNFLDGTHIRYIRPERLLHVQEARPEDRGLPFASVM